MKCLRIAVAALGAVLSFGAAQAREVPISPAARSKCPTSRGACCSAREDSSSPWPCWTLDNPVTHVAGWQGKLKVQDPQAWKQLVDRYPKAARIPLISRSSEASVSPERIVSLKPDLAIFGRTAMGRARLTP